jgi:hypothetical protein
MTPYPIDADPALDALIEAARIMVDNDVDNDRGVATCYYGQYPAHPIGTNDNCTLCQLYRALAAYEVGT